LSPRPSRRCTGGRSISIARADTHARTHVLRHAPAKLPPDARLHGERGIVDLEAARAARVLRIHLRIREHLRRVPVRELEQLREHAWLRVVHARLRGEQQRERAGRRRERVRGRGRARHGGRRASGGGEERAPVHAGPARFVLHVDARRS
jgi:hypothetical protein